MGEHRLPLYLGSRKEILSGMSGWSCCELSRKSCLRLCGPAPDIKLTFAVWVTQSRLLCTYIAICYGLEPKNRRPWTTGSTPWESGRPPAEDQSGRLLRLGHTQADAPGHFADFVRLKAACPGKLVVVKEPGFPGQGQYLRSLFFRVTPSAFGCRQLRSQSRNKVKMAASGLAGRVQLAACQRGRPDTGCRLSGGLRDGGNLHAIAHGLGKAITQLGGEGTYPAGPKCEGPPQLGQHGQGLLGPGRGGVRLRDAAVPVRCYAGRARSGAGCTRRYPILNFSAGHLCSLSPLVFPCPHGFPPAGVPLLRFGPSALKA